MGHAYCFWPLLYTATIVYDYQYIHTRLFLFVNLLLASICSQYASNKYVRSNSVQYFFKYVATFHLLLVVLVRKNVFCTWKNVFFHTGFIGIKIYSTYVCIRVAKACTYNTSRIFLAGIMQNSPLSVNARDPTVLFLICITMILFIINNMSHFIE